MTPSAVQAEPDYASSFYLDHESAAVGDFVERALVGCSPTDSARAVALYYAVRDGIFYEVYGIDVSPQGLRASSIVRSGKGFCVHKCVLYAAALRRAGIASRLVLCQVRNHLASPRLLELVGGETFLHWMTQVRLHDRWISVTPVFNKLLCTMYGIEALDFDGQADCLEHPYLAGERMEILDWMGEYSDFPYEEFLRRSQILHPLLIIGPSTATGGGLISEAPGSSSKSNSRGAARQVRT
ncbi:MAG: transglutaminase-like domain-containing protein [Actinomycetota bacterium]|nr:transglutaminase-like domain-containing protein [Actinomycetota bacterium]MDQ2957848.1 transglutaminase-like domain-containing protein [Actinomycetota bacterium]